MFNELKEEVKAKAYLEPRWATLTVNLIQNSAFGLGQWCKMQFQTSVSSNHLVDKIYSVNVVIILEVFLSNFGTRYQKAKYLEKIYIVRKGFSALPPPPTHTHTHAHF